MRLRFLGAVGTVTGSRTLVENTRGGRVLVDCGLFQGLKKLRLRNWRPFPVPPESLDAVVLTHAHVDHSGYLPRLFHQGYGNPVHATPGTHRLCEILLPDAAHLQEEEARHANRHGWSKHHPAEPLFDRRDAEGALSLFRAHPRGRPFDVLEGMKARFQNAGHIVGSASLLLEADERKVFFSGDVGRFDDALMRPPEPLPEADWIVLESTYGDRLHPEEDPLDAMAEVLRRTLKRGGVVLIPAFAVGRTQTILYLLRRLLDEGRIPSVPIAMDSPMAINATGIFQDALNEHRLTPEEIDRVCSLPRLVRDVEDSKRLDEEGGPMILISASGMATGGRVVHHLAAFVSDPRNTVLFAGFQAPGTRGERLLSGAQSIKIHGQHVPVGAEVVSLDGLSAHADADDLLAWLKTAPHRPERVVLNHGEARSTDVLRGRIEDELGFDVVVPEEGEEYPL